MNFIFNSVHPHGLSIDTVCIKFESHIRRNLNRHNIRNCRLINNRFIISLSTKFRVFSSRVSLGIAIELKAIKNSRAVSILVVNIPYN
jgi:hypothetical protein